MLQTAQCQPSSNSDVCLHCGENYRLQKNIFTFKESQILISNILLPEIDMLLLANFCKFEVALVVKVKFIAE